MLSNPVESISSQRGTRANRYRKKTMYIFAVGVDCRSRAQKVLLRKWMVVAWTSRAAGGYGHEWMDSGCTLEIELTEGRTRESQRPSAGFPI